MTPKCNCNESSTCSCTIVPSFLCHVLYNRLSLHEGAACVEASATSDLLHRRRPGRHAGTSVQESTGHHDGGAVADVKTQLELLTAIRERCECMHERQWSTDETMQMCTHICVRLCVAQFETLESDLKTPEGRFACKAALEGIRRYFGQDRIDPRTDRLLRHALILHPQTAFFPFARRNDTLDELRAEVRSQTDAPSDSHAAGVEDELVRGQRTPFCACL